MYGTFLAANLLAYTRLQHAHTIVRDKRPIVDVRWLEHCLLRGSQLADPLRLRGLKGTSGEMQVLRHVAVHQAASLSVGVRPWQLQAAGYWQADTQVCPSFSFEYVQPALCSQRVG